MKMKRLCALAVLLTSSLASAADDIVANLEGKYYAGLNFGAGWGGGFVMKPSVVLGYHHDKNSKFELEVLSNIQSLKKIGASLMANYRFYPGLDIDPVKLYVSAGLGGYFQIVPFGFGGGSKLSTSNGNAGAIAAAEESQTEGILIENTTAVDTGAQVIDIDELEKQIKLLKEVEEAVRDVKEIEKLEKKIKELQGIEREIGGGKQTINLSMVDKILNSIAYKLKAGVDYEFTPQIVGAVGLTMDGQLGGLKALQIPSAILELGIRYNF